MKFKSLTILTVILLFIFTNATNTYSQEEIKENTPPSPPKTEKPAKAPKAKAEKTPKKEKVKKEKVKKEKPSEKTKVKKTKAVPTRGMVKPLKSWNVELGFNVTNPQTDIRYNDFFGTMTPKSEYQFGGQLRVTKMLDNAIGIQAQISYNGLQGVFDTLTTIQADKQFLQTAGFQEGIYFKTSVIQGSLNLYWNISNTVFNVNKFYNALNSKQAIKKRWFSLYAYSGIGFVSYTPEVFRLSDDSKVDSTNAYPGVRYETASQLSMVIPAVVGAKFKISKTIDLGLEVGYNFVFSDNLDGFNNDVYGKRKDDGYTHASIVLGIKLGGKNTKKDHIEWSTAVEPIFTEIAKIGRLEKKVNRLAKDEDEDGVSDYFDQDVETPEGATVGANGKTLDSDGDGVIDDNDIEVFSAKGIEVDENGRALDTDHDGVPDYLDKEDGTSAGEFVNYEGRSVKKNAKIEAPNNSKLRNLALPSIFFDTDKANIKREYEDELFQMALTIKRNPGLNFILEGNCDERGTDEYNTDLALRRAEAVKKYLVDNYQLDGSIFSIVSKGKSETLSPRFNINRRVDVILVN